MPRTRVAARGHRPRNYRGARPRWRLVRTQREVICEVMRSAAECGTWLTLRELALLTRYGEASISAQLRHLRKPRYGAFVVRKRHRQYDDGVCLARRSPPWEYELAQRSTASRSHITRSRR